MAFERTASRMKTPFLSGAERRERRHEKTVDKLTDAVREAAADGTISFEVDGIVGFKRVHDESVYAEVDDHLGEDVEIEVYRCHRTFPVNLRDMSEAVIIDGVQVFDKIRLLSVGGIALGEDLSFNHDTVMRVYPPEAPNSTQEAR